MSINTGIDISNLAPNTNYSFLVYPINVNGQQADATSVSFTTLPVINTSSLISVDSSNQITVGWSGSYNTLKLYYSTDDNNYMQYGTGSYGSATTSASVIPLASNQRYYFRLDPYNSVPAAGTSVFLKDAGAVTKGYIATFSSSSSDLNSVTLNWMGVYSSVRIYYDTTSNPTTNYVEVMSSTTTSTTISSLSSGTTYYFKIYPYNSNSVQGVSSPVISKATTTGKITFTGLSPSSTVTQGSYKLYIFNTTSGTFNFSYSSQGSKTIYLLSVGGGGSGGYDRGGGGGGGGVVQKSIIIPSGSDSITVTVGAGGIAASSSTIGNNGGNTTFSFTSNTGLNVISYGGGYGGGYNNGVNSGTPNQGGSGGGGAFYSAGASQSQVAVDAGNSGNSGATSIGWNDSGGGGGAGASATAGTGGTGCLTSSSLLGIYDYYGASKYWAGGGGGAIRSSNTSGGLGGGGGGAAQLNGGSGGSGTANTGGGGGGGAQGSCPGGNGGSGILVFSILSSDVA